jgi:hypothetical protein
MTKSSGLEPIWWHKIHYVWLSGVIVNIITLAFIYTKFNPHTAPLALHYNVLIGVDEYGPGLWLYELPVLGFIIYGLNKYISGKLEVDYFLQSVLAGMSLVCSLGLLAASLFLMRVN